MAYRLLGHHGVDGGSLWADGLVVLGASCGIAGGVGNKLLGGEPGEETVGKHLDCGMEIGDGERW